MYTLYCGSNNVLILGIQIVTILSCVVLSQLYVLVVGLLQGIESLLLPTLLGMNSNIIKKGDQGQSLTFVKLVPARVILYLSKGKAGSLKLH